MSESDDNEDALHWEGMPGMMASLQRSASLPETNDDFEVEFNDSHSVDSNDSHTQSLLVDYNHGHSQSLFWLVEAAVKATTSAEAAPSHFYYGEEAQRLYGEVRHLLEGGG